LHTSVCGVPQAHKPVIDSADSIILSGDIDGYLLGYGCALDVDDAVTVDVLDDGLGGDGALLLGDGRAVLCEIKSSWRSLRLIHIEEFVALLFDFALILRYLQ
jgi:hypothetical protein